MVDYNSEHTGIEVDESVAAGIGDTYTNTSTGNFTISLSDRQTQRFVLGGNHQITMPADPGANSKFFTLELDCNGNTPTWNTSPTITWKTSDDAAPTLVTTAAYINVLVFIWDDTASAWYGFLCSKSGA